MIHRLSVALPAQEARAYPILIGADLWSTPLFLETLPAGDLLVVSNDRVAPLYLDKLKTALKGRPFATVIVPDGENHKNGATLAQIFDALAAAKIARDGKIIALGGGVVGDMAGYAAASWQRGIGVVHLPTTLLAQVDSSIGGKTGINHALGKNLIGAFHQPEAVLIDPEVLRTLPPRELRAGLGEVIKYGLLGDLEFFSWLEEHLEAILALEMTAVTAMIARCCALKAEVVGADEREQGRRALLNLGHTFGHALETLTHYRHYLHGEAVALGLVMAARISPLSPSDRTRIEVLLQRAGLPTKVDCALHPEALLQAMSRDKKVQGGQIRLVLLEALGRAVVVPGSEAEILRALEGSL